MVSAFAAGVLLLIIPIKKLLVNSKNFMHKAYIFEKKVERRNSESNRKSIFN